MIEIPLPWNQETLTKIKLLFLGQKPFTLRWWWEPFHRPGFNALSFAAARGTTLSQLETQLDQLSCVGLPSRLPLGALGSGLNRERVADAIRAAGALDDEERLVPLDPAPLIRTTLQAALIDMGPGSAERALKAFGAPHIKLATMSDLQNILGSLTSNWRPSAPEDEEVLSNWLTRGHELHTRFESLEPWSKIRLIESLVGVAKSSSVLHFQRIVV